MVLDGKIKPWAIEIGHSKLLLRSFDGDPESETPPRVTDVLFQDVSHFSLASLYLGARLTLADAGEKQREELRLGANWEGTRMFLLGADSTSGYVVAGFLYWCEVLSGVNDPSPLLAETLSPCDVRGSIYRF